MCNRVAAAVCKAKHVIVTGSQKESGHKNFTKYLKAVVMCEHHKCKVSMGCSNY